MRITIPFFILLIFITVSSYAQDWVKTDVTEFASIEFPEKSELIETQNETVFKAQDEFGYYVVSIRELTDQQSSQITEKDIPTIYRGVSDGAIRAVNGELISRNQIYIQQIPALEIEYSANSNPELPSQRFKQIIYINQSIISVDFWPLTSQKDILNKKKERFFDSFVINQNDVAKTSPVVNQEIDVSNTAYETGFVVGQIMFYLLLIAFLIGIVFLIRYLVKKNKKKNKPTDIEKPSSAKVTKMICHNCDSENRSDTKYCSKCGFELNKV